MPAPLRARWPSTAGHRLAVSTSTTAAIAWRQRSPGLRPPPDAHSRSCSSCASTPLALHALEDRRDAHAAADAQRDQRGGLAGALELVERGAEQDRAGRAE